MPQTRAKGLDMTTDSEQGLANMRKGNEGFHATQQTLFSCEIKTATASSRSTARCTAATAIAMLLI